MSVIAMPAVFPNRWLLWLWLKPNDRGVSFLSEPETLAELLKLGKPCSDIEISYQVLEAM